MHHATNGDLDRRGIGDIWTLTVREYLTSSRMTRFNYRLVRNPFILFVFAPLFLFMVLERFPSKKCKPRERRSVHLMNFALLIWCVVMSAIFGPLHFFVIQITMMAVAGSCGIWLFYVQHQFEDTYWAQSSEWDFTSTSFTANAGPAPPVSWWDYS